MLFKLPSSTLASDAANSSDVRGAMHPWAAIAAAATNPPSGLDRADLYSPPTVRSGRCAE
jgi:hypothetical protein